MVDHPKISTNRPFLKYKQHIKSLIKEYCDSEIEWDTLIGSGVSLKYYLLVQQGKSKKCALK